MIRGPAVRSRERIALKSAMWLANGEKRTFQVNAGGRTYFATQIQQQDRFGADLLNPTLWALQRRTPERGYFSVLKTDVNSAAAPAWRTAM